MVQEQDEKEFEEWWNEAHRLKVNMFPLSYWIDYYATKLGFLQGRRTLREKEAKEQIVLPDGCLPRPGDKDE